MKLLAFLVVLLGATSAFAQPLPAPGMFQTTCSAPAASTGILPAAPFACQNVCTSAATFAAPALPETPITCVPTCIAPGAPLSPGSPFTCQLVSTAPVTAPVATGISLAVPSPVTADELAGTLSVSNGPIVELNIVSGDTGNPTLVPPGYFAAYASGHLRTSAATGAALPPAGTYTLGIVAANAAGAGPITAITVIVP